MLTNSYNLPNGWSSTTIKTSCDILDNLRRPISEEKRQNRQGHVPYYGANGQQGWIDSPIFNEDLILLAEDGGNFDNYANHPIAYMIHGETWVNNHAHVLRAKYITTNTWVFYNLVHKDIRFYIRGGTRAKLNQSELQTIKIPLPPLCEQNIITHILDTLDIQIQQTAQLVAKLKQMKAGLLHDLLTRGIDENGDVRDPVVHPESFQSSKLGKIPREWDILQIKETGIVQLGRQRSPRHQTGLHTIPYLRVANVFDGFIDFSDILSMDFNPEEQKIYNLIPGDILLNEGQSLELVGRSAIYQGPPDTYCFQNTLIRFRCNSRTIPEYCRAVFKYWLDTGKFTTVAKQTTSIAHLGADRFAQMRLCVPSLDEQHRIAVILNSHNARIAAEETELAKLNQLKKGLMHDLLTGRVRVTALMAEGEQLEVRSECVSDCK